MFSGYISSSLLVFRFICTSDLKILLEMLSNEEISVALLVLKALHLCVEVSTELEDTVIPPALKSKFSFGPWYFFPHYAPAVLKDRVTLDQNQSFTRHGSYVTFTRFCYEATWLYIYLPLPLSEVIVRPHTLNVSFLPPGFVMRLSSMLMERYFRGQAMQSCKLLKNRSFESCKLCICYW